MQTNDVLCDRTTYNDLVICKDSSDCLKVTYFLFLCMIITMKCGSTSKYVTYGNININHRFVYTQYIYIYIYICVCVSAQRKGPTVGILK